MLLAFDDEDSEHADRMIEAILSSHIYVPDLWLSEVGNVLISGLKRNRISKADINEFVNKITRLKVHVIAHADVAQLHDIISLSEKCDLTYYDAQYLHLAMIRQMPLATLDKALTRAANKIGVITI